jgi:hypothetical protein
MERRRDIRLIAPDRLRARFADMTFAMIAAVQGPV